MLKFISDKFIRICGVFLVCFFVVGGIFQVWLYDKYTVPIVTYHSISDVDMPGVPTVSEKNFRKHMAYLKKNKYRVISFKEIVVGVKKRTSFPRKTVVITFDDGRIDNYTHAYPILKEYGFRATMFVPSHLIGSEGYLTWEQIREMNENGMAIGSHTRQHFYLPDLTADQMYDEIVQSKEFIEKNINSEVEYFSYPIGGFTDEIIGIVQGAGYDGACTTNRGRSRVNRYPYELNRVRMSNKDYSDTDYFMKLSGYYNLFRTARDPN